MVDYIEAALQIESRQIEDSNALVDGEGGYHREVLLIRAGEIFRASVLLISPATL